MFFLMTLEVPQKDVAGEYFKVIIPQNFKLVVYHAAQRTTNVFLVPYSNRVSGIQSTM